LATDVRVEIIDNLPARRIQIYVMPTDHQYTLYNDGKHRYENYDYGTMPEPFLDVEMEIWDAIVDKLMGHPIATEDALKDTRNMRDRLLTMVENEWQARVEGK